MKRKKIGIGLLCLVFTMFFLTACSNKNYDNVLVKVEESENQDKENTNELENVSDASLISENNETNDASGNFQTEEKVVEESEGSTNGTHSDETKKREALGITEQTITDFLATQGAKYYFSFLTQEERILYGEMYLIITKFGEDIEISSKDTHQMDYVFQCLLADHPEIFYVEGYSYTKHTINNKLNRITFSGTTIYTVEEVEKRQLLIDQYVSGCVSQMPAGIDEYGKVKYIFDYVTTHTTYNLNAADNQNICSVFLFGESVCQGYAKATQYLLDKVGIPVTLVTGYVKATGEGHAWNLIQVDGAYYYLDSTWGDGFSTIQDNDGISSGAGGQYINYDYFCVTSELLGKTHSVDGVVPMPACISVQANYYVREGSYFEQIDDAKLSSLFKNAYAQGKTFLTLKCASQDVYNAMNQYLITDMNVFQFLQNASTVSYTNSPDQYSITFWL